MNENHPHHKDKTLIDDSAFRNSVSKAELMKLGLRKVAYVRPVSYDAICQWVDSSADLDKHETYFALFAADGTPMAISNDRLAASIEAEERQMVIQSVH